MTQIHPLAIVSSGRIWAVQQNGGNESTNTPNYALFRLRNLKGPIDEVALCNAILTPQDAREDFTFEVSDYDGTSATVRIVFNNTTHHNLVQRLSIYSEIRNLSENGFYDWFAIDSATIQCMNPRPATESITLQDQPIQIETVDRVIDQISGGEYQCLPSIFPGTTLTSSEDGRTSILWGESFTNIATTIKMVNLMIFTRAKDFTETEKDRFIVFIVRILNVMKSIPILGKTIVTIEESTGGRLGHDFFKDYYEGLDHHLVKLEEALGETIISLSEGQYDNLNEHFRKMGEVLSRICPFVENGSQELNNLAEYVKKLQEKKDITDKIVKGALTGAAISLTAGLTTLFMRKLLVTWAFSCAGCAGVGGAAAYLLSNHYKNTISRYDDTHKNLKSMENLLKRMSESNNTYLNLDEGKYPGRAEILIECLKEFQEEIRKLRPSTILDTHTL
ncbi:15068_t:CDS:2 [Acaulospora morrowiae]|uniref:15068_t:CDS:1 n=1 Tax=Acaulospora morrowiae TaxID=94023 RepID=A0A9N9F3E1_9GLOM|nr:15068_t:CDS:2 [Acaulospora morrowiae]